jgi:hypothetical protein
MDNGFTITGTGYKYCAKSGSDSNAGTGTTIPYLTFSKLVTAPNNGTMILKSGHYVIDTVGLGNAAIVYADGYCILEGANPASTNLTFGVSSALYGVNIKNFNNIISSSSSIISYCTFTNILYLAHNIYYCTLLNVSLFGYNAYSSVVSQCIIKNSVINLPIATYSNFNKSILASDSVININDTSKSSFATNFTFNCCNGLVVNQTTGEVGVVPQAVDLTGGGTGTVVFASRTGSYPVGATDWMHNVLGQTATVCYVTKGNFNADPLFRNPTLGDFSVSPSSPVIGKIASQLGRLANIGYAQVTSQYNDFSGDTLSNITYSLGKYTVTSGSSGTITSGVKTIDVNYAKPLGEINLGGDFYFDVSVSGGTANRNENVPRIFTYYKQGVLKTNTNPRLSLKVRTSTKNTTPSATTDSDWDNNSIAGVNAGDWIVINIRNVRGITDVRLPRVDQNGFGDACDEYDNVFNGLIYGKYYQYMIELHNDNTQG